MKHNYIFTLLLFIAVSKLANAQTEERHVPVINDPLSPIINSTPVNGTWDLSKVNFNNYSPTETDFDLQQTTSPAQLLSQYPNLQLGDSLTGNITLPQDSKYNTQLTQVGTYCAKYEAVGKLITPTETLTNVTKINIAEQYTIINKQDSFCLQYNNTYNHFFVSGVLQPILTYSEKYRSSCKIPLTEYYKAITQPASEALRNSTTISALVQQLGLKCSPNPATGSTTISYNLPLAGNVKLELYNTANNTTTLIDSGTKEKGTYTTSASLHQLAPGTYLVKLHYQGITFTSALIVY